eukprot:TRINITY_DN5013_c0_g2_i1.p1 TRINITY_DN5013_c0_g2~~TRINITY_DN5013_c0_g2_i1.p1  ORF type:complete len:195 (+),score=43.73 TRINITY_DN5013_c0_g2_i1:58-642(+)
MSWIFCCCPGSSHAHRPTFKLSSLEPVVALDPLRVGEDAVVVKNGTRLCGAGAALASAPLMQNKSYWECVVQTGGHWSIGVATEEVDINATILGLDAASWVLRQDGGLYHKGELVERLSERVEEGDTLSCSYDHMALQFYINGQRVSGSHSGIRGRVFPVFAVDDGAILDTIFKDFQSTPPPGFDQIMVEKTLL